MPGPCLYPVSPFGVNFPTKKSLNQIGPFCQVLFLFFGVQLNRLRGQEIPTGETQNTRNMLIDPQNSLPKFLTWKLKMMVSFLWNL